MLAATRAGSDHFLGSLRRAVHCQTDEGAPCIARMRSMETTHCASLHASMRRNVLHCPRWRGKRLGNPSARFLVSETA